MNNKITCPECGRKFSEHLVKFPVFSGVNDETMVYYICPICANERKGTDKPFNLVSSQKLLEEALIEAKRYSNNYQKQPIKKNKVKQEKLVRLTDEEKEKILRHLSILEKVRNSWGSFRKISYPDEAHLDEMRLELLETDMAGCISVYISNEGKLDRKRIKILKECLVELEKEIDKIPETAKDYFLILKAISQLVLKGVIVTDKKVSS